METVMSNEVRRTLAHLATPRTLTDLAERLHSDQYVGALDVDETIDELVDKGLVVHLGRHDDSESAVQAVESNEDALGFGRGQAKIWANRVDHGIIDLSSSLYQLSKDGHAALQGDDRDVPPPDEGAADLTTEENE